MERPVAVVIVARGALVRECLRAVLQESGLQVAAEMPDLDSLSAWLADHAAGAALIAPAGNGLALASLPRGIPVVVTGTTRGREWREIGAAFALGPEAGPRELAAALEEAASIPPGERSSRPPVNAWRTLSPRQRDVLELALEGLTSREIAKRLGIGPRTVETHRADGMERLGAASFREVLLRFTAPAPLPG